METTKQLNNKYDHIRVVTNSIVNDMHYSDIGDMTYEEQVKLAKKSVDQAENYLN